MNHKMKKNLSIISLVLLATACSAAPQSWALKQNMRYTVGLKRMVANQLFLNDSVDAAAVDDVLSGGEADAGAAVDQSAEIDQNGDGIVDENDQIDQNADGAIDENDQLDQNNDGIIDENDQIDQNGDGIIDRNDQIDQNNDGIIDENDQVDQNGDGIVDENDQVDQNGDGIVDENDVDQNGDGVVDENDQIDPNDQNDDEVIDNNGDVENDRVNEMVVQLFTQLDTDNSGTLSLEEFLNIREVSKVMGCRNVSANQQAKIEAKLTDQFNQFAGADAEMDQQELANFLQSQGNKVGKFRKMFPAGQSAAKQRIQEMLAQFDANGDGVISMDELQALRDQIRAKIQDRLGNAGAGAGQVDQGNVQDQVDQAGADAQAQIDQAKADAQAKIDQAKADAQARIDQAKADAAAARASRGQ